MQKEESTEQRTEGGGTIKVADLKRNKWIETKEKRQSRREKKDEAKKKNARPDIIQQLQSKVPSVHPQKQPTNGVTATS